jgi:predicted ATPase
LFSFGAVLYELLAGHRAFYSLGAVLRDDPAPLPAVSPALEAIVTRCLRKNPAERFASISEVADALRDLSNSTLFKKSSIANSFEFERLQHRRTVGREKELLHLRATLNSISNGAGRMLAISGDAGIGKTTLIEDFLSSVEASGAPFWIARGRCSERLEKTDPFVPILECLGDFISGQRAAEGLQIMENTAPLWLAQLRPGSLDQESRAAKVSSERLRREFVRLFQALSVIRPILLFLDDLHWVDASTCDLLAHLSTRARDIRILLTVAYRPSKVMTAHPFLPLKLALEREDASQEIALASLTRADVECYLSSRFPASRFPVEFADAVFERTEGHPLFMKNMIGFLLDRQMILRSRGRWHLNLNIENIRTLIPAGTESMIRLQIDQFSEIDRQILQCAAIQGVEFDSAVICQVLGLGAEQIEERLQSLARIHRFVYSLSATVSLTWCTRTHSVLICRLHDGQRTVWRWPSRCSPLPRALRRR